MRRPGLDCAWFPLLVFVSLSSCSKSKLDCLEATIAECRQRCDDESPKACLMMGWWYRNGHQDDSGNILARDRKKGFETFSKLCKEGYEPGCGDLAMSYANGEGTPRDLQQAADIASASCDRGGARSCVVLGTDIAEMSGLSGKAAMVRAGAAYARDCEAGDATACWMAALHSPAKSDEAAVRMLKRACDLGYWKSDAAYCGGTAETEGNFDSEGKPAVLKAQARWRAQ